MVKVKICGITNLQDAQAAIKAGCDALGFVFYRKSPRFVSGQKAKEIIAGLPKKVLKVGVFVNAREKRIKKIAKSCCLDILQFHGDESPEFCQRFKHYKIIKAFRVKESPNLKAIARYKVFACLFDSFNRKKFGGTGKRFSWQLLKGLSALRQQIFLSGGLNTQNVRRAISTVHPQWVDVSSGVETSPGKKDPRKLIKFIKTVRGVIPGLIG